MARNSGRKRHPIIFVIVIIVIIILAISCASDSTESEPQVNTNNTVHVDNVMDETETALNEETVEDTYDYGSMSVPHDITGDDISNIRPGEYVRVTARAQAKSTSEGIISIGGNDDGTWSSAGLELFIEDSSGNEYVIQAFSVSPGDFEDIFYEHPPKDFSLEPSTVGDYKYSGCNATIVGCVSNLIYSDETNRLLGFEFGSESVVEDLELYY